MMTLATARAALTEPDPFDGIDRLIRDELTRGRTTREVHDDLFPLVRDLRHSGELSDDADEALLGALDALTGRCHPDCRYTDPAPSHPVPPLHQSLPSHAPAPEGV
ncbi:unnamed protein product [Gemmataceae bacterium]|nr:unnamed protein product [Gemmataceae bacterium]VTU00637.1 unnamed protein product [Gemmataceae bacterium]